MELIHLIEVSAYDPAANAGAGGVIILRFSSGVGFTTQTSETPSDTPYPPRVKSPGVSRTDIFAKGKTGGSSNMGHGEIILTNIDGALDYMVDLGFDGRTLTHRIGPARRGAYPTDYPIQETYTMEQLQIGWSDISILVRDKQFVLDKPLQGNLYAGNNSLPNGLEGVATDLGGKPKILVYGEVFNVPVPMVNTSKLIFQLNDGAISSATLYDQGLALTLGTDYTSESDMTTNAPTAGYFRLYKAGGYARVGSSPAGLVTADIVQGAAASNRTAAQIIKAIALKGGLSSGEISTGDVTALDTANSSVNGIAFIAETNIREAIDTLCASVGAWWTFDVGGVLRFSRLETPVSDANSPILTSADLKNNISRDPTGDNDRGVPIWKVILKYARNHVTQTSDLAGAVAADRRGLLAQEWRTVTAEDSSVQTKHLLASEMEIETTLVTAANAQTEADRQLALRSIRRDRLTVSVLSEQFKNILLGDIVVINIPRFGYDGGKDFIVIGRQPDYRLGRGELTLWG